MTQNLPIEEDVLFSNHKGVRKGRVEKKMRKLLEKVSFLRPFLVEGEKVLLVTRACSPSSFFEQFLTGWIVYYLKRSLLVFTNKRIFHIPTTMRYNYRNSVASISYGDCEDIRMKGRQLAVTYRKGGKEQFLYVSEKKKIKAMLKDLALEAGTATQGGRTHLCPKCTGELKQDVYSCPSCRLEFKDMGTARKLSLLYPGGGYFYARHPILGLSDALTELFLMVMVVIAFITVINGEQGALPILVLFGIVLAMEKALTVYHAKHFIKEYIPVDKDLPDKPRVA